MQLAGSYAFCHAQPPSSTPHACAVHVTSLARAPPSTVYVKQLLTGLLCVREASPLPPLGADVQQQPHRHVSRSRDAAAEDTVQLDDVLVRAAMSCTYSLFSILALLRNQQTAIFLPARQW